MRIDDVRSNWWLAFVVAGVLYIGGMVLLSKFDDSPLRRVIWLMVVGGLVYLYFITRDAGKE